MVHTGLDSLLDLSLHELYDYYTILVEKIEKENEEKSRNHYR